MSPKSQAGVRLAGVPPGETVRVTGVEGGIRVQSRLIGMGLIAGVRLDVRRNDGSGPVLFAVGHARIALGRGMAENVCVEPLKPGLPGYALERRFA
jgi:Fe2+ transport system protein FeoA